jgi:hypothetical protein
MQASLAKGRQMLEVAASFDKPANLAIAAHACSMQQLFSIAQQGLLPVFVLRLREKPACVRVQLLRYVAEGIRTKLPLQHLPLDDVGDGAAQVLSSSSSSSTYQWLTPSTT